LPPWRQALLPGFAAILVLAALVLSYGIARELTTSEYQARYFVREAAGLKFQVEPGASDSARFPQSGPYDQRLGYTRIPEFVERLRSRGYEVSAQARTSGALSDWIAEGYFPPYEEKSQAGLRILDCDGEPLFRFDHPANVYPHLAAVPPRVVNALLFIENRELLQDTYPQRNPAVEWARLARAVLERGIKAVDPDYDAPGGSTLATQIEKYRHSPGSVTPSIEDKFRQMVSASLRAYAHGPDTTARRRQIAVDYLNTFPLAAAPGHGEVNGLGDGLAVWYGADFHAVNALLFPRADESGADLNAEALAFRQVLSLLVAQRRPTYFLGPGREQLAQLTDSYLRLLAAAGVIEPALRDAALKTRLTFRDDAGAPPPAPGATWKGVNAVRARLMALLQSASLYDVDRLDLSAASTLQAPLGDSVTALLTRLGDPAHTRALRLGETRLLERGDPAQVLYSFTLYERGPDANRVRVQTDNFNQPFDINEGARLELGSTAKLRALATYLEIIATLHERYAGLSTAELRRVEVDRRDALTRWTVEWLAAARERDLAALLAAAMERRYPASATEQFFTGGGVHTFANFKREDNARVPTVREALRDSINLPFVRLMRDVVYHHLYRAPETPARVLEDAHHPRRSAYIARFADHEGREFVRRYYRKYRGVSPDQALDTLIENLHATPQRLAVIYRTVEPGAGLAAFTAFLRKRLPASRLPDAELAALYERHAPGRYSLADRGYLARVHPLELWIVAYLRRQPDAGLAQAIEASTAERQDVYTWLSRTHQKNAQDIRIRTLLEMEAFDEIHRHWKRLAYPFESLVPSYATAIGVSGDRPAALAELIGIILNDGVRQPTVRIESLAFAADTPYETQFRRVAAASERVMKSEVATTLKRALASVVDSGTARRLRGAFAYPDRTELALGGKTGTGDNRFGVYGAGGKLLESRVVSRTATFAFFLGERHFGVLTAYVPGAQAEKYNFTSALPVQILKALAPQLRPYLHPASAARCPQS